MRISNRLYLILNLIVAIQTTVLFAALTSRAVAEAPPLSSLAKIPVKEVTVFKDGHAFVVHQGKMATDRDGNVHMDYLPTPVIGTFWAASNDKSVKLSAVTASPRRVRIERTSLSLQELIEANKGAEIKVAETGGKSYTAHIVGAPERSWEEMEKTNVPGGAVRPPIKGTVILLQTKEGTIAVPRDHIKEATFLGPYRSTITDEEYRNLLTLKLDWPGNRPAKLADVSMMYLEAGIRWIPSYKIVIDGKGGANVSLQASLINELTDLNDVTLNLVIGVPKFAFQETPDPIGLQQTFAQLSPYFQNGSQTSYAMSNSLMSQVGGQSGFGGRGFGAEGAPGSQGPGGPQPGPEVAGAGKNEDTFIFTVKHVTLKKGQRMIVPIFETKLTYHDIYTLDIAVGAPSELRTAANLSEQQWEAIRLQNLPKVIHNIRLTNTSHAPLTTAPALILSNDRVLAQSMMTYTSIGGEADLALTTAVDIKVKKKEQEVSRTPNAATWQNTAYARVDLAGVISLTNFDARTVEIEVTRNVFGNVAEADQNGVKSVTNALEDDDLIARAERPSWWYSYNWPYWWNRFNSLGRIEWKVKIDPGKSIDLNYKWNYYWR